MKKYLRALYITMLASLSIGLAACDKTPDGTNGNGASGYKKGCFFSQNYKFTHISST